MTKERMQARPTDARVEKTVDFEEAGHVFIKYTRVQPQRLPRHLGTFCQRCGLMPHEVIGPAIPTEFEECTGVRS